jgi:hypothetical protein
LKTFINETEDHVNKRLNFSEEFSSVDNQRVEKKYLQFLKVVADITVDFIEIFRKNCENFSPENFLQLN